MPFVAIDSYLGIGKESTWGTPVSRTAWMRLISSSIQRKKTNVRRPHLAASANSRNAQKYYESEENVSGTFEVEVTYEGFGILLAAVLGGTPQTSGPSGGIYTHEYGLGTGNLSGHTIEVVKGNSSNSDLFEGCKITKMTVKIDAGGVMRAVCEVIGQTGTRPSAGTPSVSVDLPVLHHHAGDWTWNSVGYGLKSFDLMIDNKLSRRQLLGSSATKEPMRSDLMEIVLNTTLEYSDDNLWTAHQAQTQSDGAITFDGGSGKTLLLDLHNAFIDDYSDPVNSAGIIERTAKYIALSDGTNEGLLITVTNSQSSATAAG